MSFKKQEIRKAIEKKLSLKPRRGKENFVWYELDGNRILRITYPKGSGEIPKGTESSMRFQFRLDKREFKSLIKCPLSAKDYENIIRNKIKQNLL